MAKEKPHAARAEQPPAIAPVPTPLSRRVTSAELDRGDVQLDDDVAIHACASCGVQFEDRYHLDCPSCGAWGCPVSSCRACSTPLVLETLQFVSLSESASVSKSICGVRCPACGLWGVEGHELSALAELATSVELANVPGPLEILPERGYFTAQRLEVLADADVGGTEEPEEVEKRGGGLVLRVGAPSALFDAALGVITDHEPGDIFSPTLTLTPGPPYDDRQRATIQRLLVEVQRDLGSAVSCWSASVGLSEQPLVDPVLAQQLSEQHDAADAVALALYNAILTGRAPGRLLNSVRLLERVLGDPPPERLAETLRVAVEQRGRQALPVLEQLWRAMYPGRAFDEARVYAEMQEFHARCAMPDGGLELPWEQPDHEGYSAWLRRLVSELL